MLRFSDPAGSVDGSRKRRRRSCLPLPMTASAPRLVFTRLNSPARAYPYRRFAAALADSRRTARGHRGSLALRCRAFSSPSPSRFIPALSKGIARPDRPREPKQSWRPQGPTGLDVRDHDTAPSLLNPDSEQAGSRSCVGRDGTDGRRDLDQVAAAWLGRSGHLCHLIAAAISAAPFRPLQGADQPSAWLPLAKARQAPEPQVQRGAARLAGVSETLVIRAMCDLRWDLSVSVSSPLVDQDRLVGIGKDAVDVGWVVGVVERRRGPASDEEAGDVGCDAVRRFGMAWV